MTATLDPMSPVTIPDDLLTEIGYATKTFWWAKRQQRKHVGVALRKLANYIDEAVFMPMPKGATFEERQEFETARFRVIGDNRHPAQVEGPSAPTFKQDVAEYLAVVQRVHTTIDSDLDRQAQRRQDYGVDPTAPNLTLRSLPRAEKRLDELNALIEVASTIPTTSNGCKQMEALARAFDEDTVFGDSDAMVEYLNRNARHVDETWTHYDATIGSLEYAARSAGLDDSVIRQVVESLETEISESLGVDTYIHNSKVVRAYEAAAADTRTLS